jgi:hypothetical protein
MFVKSRDVLFRCIRSLHRSARGGRWVTLSITSIRRQNALALLNEFATARLSAGESAKGTEQAFAVQVQLHPAAWSAHKTHRPIGDKLARQIEALCSKESGWLDVERVYLEPDPSEVAFMSLAQAAWRASNAGGKKELKLSMKRVLAVAKHRAS